MAWNGDPLWMLAFAALAKHDEDHWLQATATIGQLLAAVVAIIITFSGFMFAQAVHQGTHDEKVLQLEKRVDVIGNRQTFNEANISKLQIDSALQDQRYSSMQAEHAQIYAAIERTAHPQTNIYNTPLRPIIPPVKK